MGYPSLLTGEGGLLDVAGGNTPAPNTQVSGADWFDNILNQSIGMATDYMEMKTAQAQASALQAGVLGTAETANNFRVGQPYSPQVSNPVNQVQPSSLVQMFSNLSPLQQGALIAAGFAVAYLVMKKL